MVFVENPAALHRSMGEGVDFDDFTPPPAEIPTSGRIIGPNQAHRKRLNWRSLVQFLGIYDFPGAPSFPRDE